ncbi:MAG: HlyD family efflux transporter periplasmic adaptor subunit, partial [Eubacteriales bacterium]
STVLSIGLTVFLLYHIIGSLTTDVETTTIVYTTQEDVTDYDAYIFRSEVLLYTSPGQTGSINYLREDGTKVAAGQEVCQVYAGSTTEESSVALQEIERSLKRLKNSNLDENVNYTDTQLIDTTIFNAYYTILNRMAEGTAGYAMAKSDDLISAMNQRLIITKHVENFDDRIAELEAQRSALVTSSGTVAETVTTDLSGYFYADIDGFEEIFSSSKIDNMTLDAFDSLISSSADLSLETNAEGGKNCGKIINEYNWYIGVKITTEESRSYTEGYTYTVIFPYNSDVRIPMILDRMVLQADDDRVILLFRTNTIPEHFSFLRRQSVQIVTNTCEGYKVPISAVRIVDGEQGVYVLEGYIVQFRRIEPLREIDGYFICRENDGSQDDADMLELYDHIIINGKNLYVGKIIS